MSGASGCARAREVVGEGGGSVVGKILKSGRGSATSKCVRPAEQTGEEIEDAIEIEVETKFPGAAATQIRNVSDELPAFNRSLARTEIVATNVQAAARAGIDDSLWVAAVSEPRFFVTGKLEAKLIYQVLGQRRRHRAGQRVTLDAAVARVIFSAQRPVVLVVLSVEALMVVPQQELIAAVKFDVALTEKYVLSAADFIGMDFRDQNSCRPTYDWYLHHPYHIHLL